jgi:poly-gamma-glutamate synthesis protein (capsule biosynthesis protein)
MMKKYFLSVICFLIIACTSTPQVTVTSEVTVTSIPPTATSTTSPALWISDSAPDDLIKFVETSNIKIIDDINSATQILDVNDSGSTTWIYALVASFPTLTDDTASSNLISIWKGESTDHKLIMAESTLRAFTAKWGEPSSSQVRSVPSDKLLDEAWADKSLWVIIPFEEINPRWKVLSVDGQSPIHKDFDENDYPLKIIFGGTSFELPKSNRDPAKLTTVVLTGVTAMVRATAFTMETKGITRPGELIYDWLSNADVTHISNEVPFDPSCPTPSAGYKNFILCSDPKYFELLQYIGVDVIELTGDHFADRGTQAMLDTLEIYKENNIPYYGGAANEDEARLPVLMEVNGNKIAFIGCNGKIKYTFVKATDTKPGAANCDYNFFTQLIKDVSAQGYMVIFTFQHEECYHVGPCYKHEEGFHAVADAGATIVSGSQAHYSHVMEFRGDSFIHFGLGNLFFDQMTYELSDGSIIDETRREFIDRHVFYNGKYLGVELLTAMLEDFSRPRPMNERERAQFLSEYFFYSGWTDLSPTPIPQATVTLTPIVLPTP